MFIAHLPAGYLATRLILDRQPVPQPLRHRLLVLGMIASLLPDLDLLWFYFVDHRRQVHHAYLPHLPLAWVALFTVAALVLRLRRAGRTAWLAMIVVAANILLHQVLDTLAGGIRWAWPFSRAELVLSHVEARYDPWYLNFPPPLVLRPGDRRPRRGALVRVAPPRCETLIYVSPAEDRIRITET